jgi:membrane protease YdiL (CAAX protease family)
MAISPPRRRRRTALLRGLTLIPGLLRVAGLRIATALLWPVAAVCVLTVARVPAWWRALAGRTLLRAARQRAHAWLLSDVRAAERAAAALPVTVPDLGRGLRRRSLLARIVLAPGYGVIRWVLGTFAVLFAMAAWVTLVVARRHPPRLRAAQFRVLALCGDIDAYLLLLVPARPHWPEPDPRLAPAGAPGPDHVPLPPWSRRTGRLAVGLDLFCGVVVIGFAYGILDAVGVNPDDSLGALLALDLLIQTLAPLMGFYLAASEAPLTVAQLGLGVLRPRRSLGAAALLIAAYPVVALSLGALTVPFLADTNGSRIVPDGSGPGWTIVFLALATVIAPVFEETFYRGIMFQALRAGRGTWTAAVVSSVFFALAHLDFNPVAIADRSLIGIGLCYLFARTGRLLPGMLAHSMNNAIVLPLSIGWTWQVPIVIVASLVGVMLVAALVSSRRGTWDPVGLGLGLVDAEPIVALTAQEHRDGAVP